MELETKKKMKLYGIASSTCTGRVLLSLFEKEVEDFELVIVNVRKGEGKKPEYLKLQPFGLIPVLEDGDLTLYESRAIIRYIANKYEGQGTALYGKDIKGRAKVDQWLEVEGQNFNSAIRSSLGVVSKPPIDEVLLTEAIGKLGKVLDIYEDHLSKTQYLAGDFFSLADLSHMTTGWKLFDKYKQGSILFEGRPHVKAWWENISSRPAFKKLLEMI
jgi:glutathione S-transferase